MFARAFAPPPTVATAIAAPLAAAAPIEASAAVATATTRDPLGAAPPTGDSLAATAPAGPQAVAQPPPSAAAAERPASDAAQAIAFAPPEAQDLSAALAWSGGAGEEIDALGLNAVQSFLPATDASRSGVSAGAVRDGMAATLASVPCARIQAAFSPETGSIEVRGHVPEAGLVAPVLASLRRQLGASIPVVDNLRILPPPQCGALAGLAALALPQSTDQENDPRLVGPDAHARSYAYVAGERMILDMTAPDYPAFVYVDYFDAQGMVVHLVPNDRAPLERHEAKATVRIGADRADGRVLPVVVGPPFGEEIAVAFAASAPLYDGVRPTVEPAAPYLEWLRQRVAAARAADPGFKGEWVYFFVSTSAAN
jgi:hypothetical protein